MTMGSLEGFRIGVTADRRSHEQVDYLQTHGAEVLRGACEQTMITDPDALRRATEILLERPPDLLVATSAVGVRSWMTHITSWGLDEQVRATLRNTRIVAVGQETFGELAAADLLPSSRAEADPEHVSAVLQLEDHRVARAVVQLDGDESTEIVRVLKRDGIEVDTLSTYRWQIPDDRGPATRLVRAIARGTVHAVTFTTPVAVRGFFEIATDLRLGDDASAAFRRGAIAACVGPMAAEAARREGIDEPMVPELPRVAYMLRDLTVRLGAMRRTLRTPRSSAVIQGELVCVDDARVVLSTRERMLFDAFTERPGEVLSKDELLREVWPGRRNQGHLVEVTVARLRERLGPAFGPAIVAVRRRGYRLDALAG